MIKIEIDDFGKANKIIPTPSLQIQPYDNVLFTHKWTDNLIMSEFMVGDVTEQELKKIVRHDDYQCFDNPNALYF